MESDEEAFRLDIKTDPETVKDQAGWCGVRPGIRVLDAGCGPGKTSAIFHKMVQSSGEVVGLDYSVERIRGATERYKGRPGISFQVHDLTEPLDEFGMFDLIWVRFVLEYNRSKNIDIVRNLTHCLKPGGHLCLLDLDYNCLSHYEMPTRLEGIMDQLMFILQEKYDFDPYVGRKLYAYMYDRGLEDIQLDLRAHHLIYGKVSEVDAFNWTKKAQVTSMRVAEIFEGYPGGHAGFLDDFTRFFNDPRRFTYTPLILCKGRKPLSP